MKDNLKQMGDSRKLLALVLPFMASYLMQSSYGLADLVIIGIYETISCTAAVAIATQVMHMVTTVAVSLAIGCADAVKTEYEKGDKDGVERIIGSTIALYGSFAFIMAAVMNILVPFFVSILNVPSAADSATRLYLHIVFDSLPFIAITNLANSTFRGLGESRTPMYILLFSSILNIILDIVFVGMLGYGAAGAASATLVSSVVNSIGVVAALHFFLKKKGIFVNIRRIRIVREYVEPITEMGVQISLQELLLQISMLFITAIINRRGLTDAAACSIVEKLVSFLLLIFSSLSASVTVLASHERENGMKDRGKSYLYYGILFAGMFGIAVTALIQLFPSTVMSFFTEDPAVIKNGTKYLRGYSLGLVFAAFHYVYTGYFNASGYTGISFMHNIVSSVFLRIPGVYFVSILFPRNLFPVGIASASGSVFSAVTCVVLFCYMEAQKSRGGGRRLKDIERVYEKRDGRSHF